MFNFFRGKIDFIKSRRLKLILTITPKSYPKYMISVDTVCDRMLEDDDYWCCWSSFKQGILRAKKTDLDRNAGQIQDPNG
ncbi:hypothetical protein J6590_065389 [Homalodisca vitripennis]|nr:hypothetical protein J6590_065389 [Homalodisca vitripennis]